MVGIYDEQNQLIVKAKRNTAKKVNFLYLGDILLAEEVQHAPAGEEFEAPSFKTPEVDTQTA